MPTVKLDPPIKISNNLEYYFEYMYRPYVDDNVLIKKLWGINGNKDSNSTYADQYLTYEILEPGYMGLYIPQEFPFEVDIKYSLNGNNWAQLVDPVQVEEGDIVRFKGNNTAFYDVNTDEPVLIFVMNDITLDEEPVEFNTYGNIMSIIYGDEFKGKTEFPNNSAYNFSYFFDHSGIVDASNLILPVTTLTEGCYSYMFEGSNLVYAPELPAKILTDYCYQSMFDNCTNLGYIKCLATDISAEDCTSLWTYRVNTDHVGIFVKDPSMEDWTETLSYLDNGDIPYGWICISDQNQNLITNVDGSIGITNKPRKVVVWNKLGEPLTLTYDNTKISVEVSQITDKLSMLTIATEEAFSATPITISNGVTDLTYGVFGQII